MKRIVPSLLLCALATGLRAQTCMRPTPPPGGFAASVELSVPVTYSDAYATFGTMQFPSDAPPTCGWPLVVYVHPLGLSRFEDFALQSQIAAQGFAVYSYDVRGQGEAALANTTHPNQGTTLWGPIEGHDMAEQIAFVASHAPWSGVVDATRVAVIGRSQGGGHAWMAAAWSGTTLQTPGRTDVTLPPIACAIAHDLVATSIDDWLRDGAQFSSWWVEAISGNYQGVPFDPAFTQTGREAFESQDPAGLAQTWTLQGRDLGADLAQSTVPFLYEHAYFDYVHHALTGIERLESMQGPTRLVMSTIGHGAQPNDVEAELRVATALRWLDRFLWDIANEVEFEHPHRLAVLPLDPALREDPTHLWGHVQLDELTTPATAQRMHLHDDFTLLAGEATAPAALPAIAQVVDPLAVDFTAIDYLADPVLRDVDSVLLRCPLQELVWQATLADEQDLVSSASLHLHVVPDGPQWLLAALLTATPPGGDEVMLTHNAVASRTSVAGVAEQHDLRMPPIAARLPAGTVLRLRLRNLYLQEAPMARRLDAAPIFGDYRVEVVVDGAGLGSWIDLPLRAPAPQLVCDRVDLELELAPVTSIAVRGGAARAGAPYFAAVGLSGQYPETSFFGVPMPIEVDWLVLASAASGPNVFYQGFFGLLDGDGAATCSFDYSSVAPMPQFLNGLHLTVCAFAWDGAMSFTGTASNAVNVVLR